jgi:hypothetical protein
MADTAVRKQKSSIIQSNLDRLLPQTVKQYAFVSGLKHILNTTYMSTDASMEAFIELFPPEALVCNPCLKQSLFYIHMRDVMRFVGVTVEQRQGLYIPQAVFNAIFGNDPTLRNTANWYMEYYRQATSTASVTIHASDARGSASGVERFDFEACLRVSAFQFTR